MNDKMTFSSIAFLLLFAAAAVMGQESWTSQIVYPGEDGKLVYVADDSGNVIPDFSYAGYKNSEDSIPFVPVVKTIDPVEGDNTSHIQSALFEVGLMSPDENGFRGALLLNPGVYEVTGTIKVQFDGIVLRGSGDGEDPASNTIIYATGNSPSKRTVIVAGGGSSTKWSDKVSGSIRNITSDTVRVGDRSFDVTDASVYRVGDNIIIYHQATEAWLESIDYGGTHSDEGGAEPGVDVPWSVGSTPIVYNRYIKEINGNTITVGAPVYNHLIRELSQAEIYIYSQNNLRRNIGIENLRVDIANQGHPDENHAWNAIDLYLIEDAWVRDCTMLHFGLSGIRTNTATRVTVENCKALDPVAEVVGGNMYNFNAYTASQQILFKNCHASNGRHHYMSNGFSWTSGIVFLDCTSEGAFASSEGHRRWTQAMLYDNFRELDGPRQGYNKRLLGLYNRGYYGTSHGWSAAHSVAWNCDVNDGYLIVQKPPTAQNYAIGCSGAKVSGVLPYAEFDEPEGYIEGSNQSGLNPRSLFLAQLEERLDGISSIAEERPKAVKIFTLHQNYPNPFNPATQIAFELPEAGDIKLSVYDVSGRKIADLLSGWQAAGLKRVKWNGQNYLGYSVASGIYFYRLNFKGVSETKRMVLIR